MSDEETNAGLPADADDALAELLDDAREHARSGEDDELVETLDALAAIARDELPDGDRKDRLLHGCERVETHAGDDYAVATEYLRAMGSLVE